MYWYNYEVLKKWLCAKSGLYEPTFMVSFTSGALSGSVSLFLLIFQNNNNCLIKTEQNII